MNIITTTANTVPQKNAKRLSVFLSLLLISSVTVTKVVADQAAMSLLNKMNQALVQLNYKGTIAYLHGDELSTFLIDHSVISGEKRERVVRLNKSGATFSRELHNFSLSSLPRINSAMKSVYSFDFGRTNTVATIPCVVVTARPKDRERYLQKYCIDTKTGMLLDYMLVDKSHKPVEHLMFTTIAITFPESVAKSEVSFSNTSINSSSAVAPSLVSKTKKLVSKKSRIVLDDGWVMESLPAGYDIRQLPDANDMEIVSKHYVVSDGLSSLSVFVSPLSESDFNVEGAVKINSGALNVVSQRKGSHVVTAVGEVPESTLKTIVNKLRKK